METMLIAVTLISLVVALTMSVVAWRASQEQKRLAAARVASLAAAAAVPVPAVPSVASTAGTATLDAEVIPAGSPWRSPGAVETPRDTPLSSFSSEAGRGAAQAARVEAVPPPAAPQVAVQSGFLAAEPSAPESNTHQRWLAAAAAVLAVALTGVVYLRMSATGAQAVAAQVQAASSPLELLSLRHEREGVNLAVAGLVRNPPTGVLVERVTAMVYLFDAAGTFVTSAKAPIDFLKLTAGDESPFVVKVAAPQSVARYRVSFRTEDGTLPHVDRRGEPPAATPVSLARP
jgi:hypothetical protein